jgi:UDP-3-O-[3-hydroxymyristoyl] glucosamine N-acyltransferase
MYRIKQHDTWASDIAEYLNSDLIGEDVLLPGPYAIRTLESIQRRGVPEAPDPWIAIVPRNATGELPIHRIASDNPERDVARTLLEFFATPVDQGIDHAARVADGARIGRNVRIGPNAMIDPDVEIGDGSWIMANVVVRGPARIGRHSVIKDGAVVGSEAYGFVEDERGHLIHAPQLGRVLIGDHAWIGANTTIERGMLEDTVIDDEAKIDDLVHVGRGCVIGRRSLITAGCVLAYDVRIGNDVRLAPNVSVRERLNIADGVVVGQGAVVVESIVVAGTFVGVPARRVDTESKGSRG